LSSRLYPKWHYHPGIKKDLDFHAGPEMQAPLQSRKKCIPEKSDWKKCSGKTAFIESLFRKNSQRQILHSGNLYLIKALLHQEKFSLMKKIHGLMNFNFHYVYHHRPSNFFLVFRRTSFFLYHKIH